MTAPYNPIEDMWRCSKCGSLNNPDEICWTCYDIEADHDDLDLISDAERCQECDRWIEDDEVCPYCGTVQEQQP